MKYLSKSLEETSRIAGDFVMHIQNTYTHTNRATVVGLFGDLGSGKTTFTQALGKHLNVKEVMTSPTFVIMKKYNVKLDNQGPALGTHKARPWLNLIHIDAYRLESGQELLSLGFEDLLNDPHNLILIEWPERVVDILPADLFKINLKFISEMEREIEFQNML